LWRPGLCRRGAAGADAEPIKFVRQVRDAASDLVLSAMNFVGVPYRRGGETADQGFDCSGFTRYVFENSLGLVLPRRADQQAREVGLMQVVREDLEPGATERFTWHRSRRPSH
jgi:cell wall-associated NlpC family hydrolase